MVSYTSIKYFSHPTVADAITTYEVNRRQILDMPLIHNEIVSCCKSTKEQALLFKVDFQKAFDSVRWDHLDDILEAYDKDTLFSSVY
ncbi:hypothetical protein Tco_0793078 [Tanacetum coccineum]